MGKSEKKLGAPVQPEIRRRLAVLRLLERLARQAGNKIALIDLCRAVAQMDPAFFSADLPSAGEMDVLHAIACGRNTLSDRVWEGVDAAAQREAGRDFPVDASGGRSSQGEKRFEARLRAVRARLFRERRAREMARLAVFEAGATALKTAFYSLRGVERSALVAGESGTNCVDLFEATERWKIG